MLSHRLVAPGEGDKKIVALRDEPAAVASSLVPIVPDGNAYIQSANT